MWSPQDRKPTSICPWLHPELSSTHSYRKVKWVTEFIFAQVIPFTLKKKKKSLALNAGSVSKQLRDPRQTIWPFFPWTASLQKQDTTTSLSEAVSGCHQWHFWRTKENPARGLVQCELPILLRDTSLGKDVLHLLNDVNMCCRFTLSGRGGI